MKDAPHSPLVLTKLRVPAPRPYILHRARLLERLTLEPGTGLVLFSAPPGYGKTTLLADWARKLRQCGMAIAWLSLDASDDDPGLFASYLVAALSLALGPSSGLPPLEELLNSAPGLSLDVILPAVINAVSANNQDCSLFLDDYHLISSPAVHSAIGFLLEHMPETMHLVIGSRSDPPLPLARMRARGLLKELRGPDLQFTEEEASSFLRQSMRLPLSEKDAALLTASTEGWIAGLQMAALALRMPHNAGATTTPSDFIAAFDGTNRYILDYLLDEVLTHQTEETLEFLLHTSILDELCAPLCDALLETTGSQSRLEGLERDNLFLIPLDEARHWYHYHHLFADLLRKRLQDLKPEQVKVLHLRASGWYERAGRLEPAVAHARAVGDWERVARLIQTNWRQMISTGQLRPALRWLESLPEARVRQDPVLGIFYCWLLLMTGQTAAVPARFEFALMAWEEIQQRGKGPDEADYRALPSLIAVVQAVMSRSRGEQDQAIAYGQEAVMLAERAGDWERAVTLLMLGHSYRLAGELEEAVGAYDRVIPLARSVGFRMAETTSAFYVAHVERLQGRLARGFALCQETLGAAERAGTDRLPAYSLVHIGLAEILMERNELESAEQHLSIGLQLNGLGQEHQARVFGHLGKARLALIGGDPDTASQELDQTQTLLQKLPVPLAAAELQAARVRVWLADGSRTAATHWAADFSNRMNQGGPLEGVGLENGAYARVQLGLGQARVAADYLDRALGAGHSQTGTSGNGPSFVSTVELQVLRAVARDALGDIKGALEDLEYALEMAEPEGHVRVFVDEGPAIAHLLRRGLANGKWSGAIGSYARRLLGVLGSEEKTEPVISQAAVTATEKTWGEALSERELEVLRSLASGASNQEIADKLVITIGTVKSHINHILVKLDAHNRTEAVARARERHLL